MTTLQFNLQFALEFSFFFLSFYILNPYKIFPIEIILFTSISRFQFKYRNVIFCFGIFMFINITLKLKKYHISEV